MDDPPRPPSRFPLPPDRFPRFPGRFPRLPDRFPGFLDPLPRVLDHFPSFPDLFPHSPWRLPGFPDDFPLFLDHFPRSSNYFPAFSGEFPRGEAGAAFGSDHFPRGETGRGALPVRAAAEESELAVFPEDNLQSRMSMVKRLQIPVSEQDCSHFQAAARRAGLPLSEWARRQLREKAKETMGGTVLGPHEALALIKALDAPVGPVETMIEESVAGHYS
jgi:hypothetical protein